MEQFSAFTSLFIACDKIVYDCPRSVMMVVQGQGGIDMKPTAIDIEDFVRDLFH